MQKPKNPITSFIMTAWLAIFFISFIIFFIGSHKSYSDGKKIAGIHLAVEAGALYFNGEKKLSEKLLENAKKYGSYAPFVTLENIKIHEQLEGMDINNMSLEEIENIDVTYRDNSIFNAIQQLDNHELQLYLGLHSAIYMNHKKRIIRGEDSIKKVFLLLSSRSNFSNETIEKLLSCKKQLDWYKNFTRYLVFLPIKSEGKCIDLFYNSEKVIKEGLLLAKKTNEK